MSKHYILLCIAAALCVSGRSALLLSGVISLVYLLTLLLRTLLMVLKLPCTALRTTVFSVAAGSGLYLLLLAFVPQSKPDLGAVVPLLAVCFLCAAAVGETPPSLGRWFICIGVLTAIGCVRELLSTASLFGYPLPFSAAGEVFGRTAAGTIGIGGLLIAAAILWVFRQGRPLEKGRPFCGKNALQLGMVTTMAAAADGVLRGIVPDLPDLWRFWIALLLTILPLVWDEDRFPWITVLLVPVTVLWISGENVGTWIATGIGVGIGTLTLTAVWDRLYRSLPPSRFAGAPAVLTVAAILLSALHAAV